VDIVEYRSLMGSEQSKEGNGGREGFVGRSPCLKAS